MANRFTRSPAHRVILSVILIAYFIIGSLYAARTPAWQVPDEPAHYNVIRQIAETGSLPRLEPGDYDQAYLSELTSKRFPPELPIEKVQYQDYQPPLYYLLLAPVYLAFAGALLPLRLVSLLLGAGVIVFAFRAVAELFPARPYLALTTAGLMAFIPQHVAMLAGVNNDSLSELLIAIGLWLALRFNRRGWTAAVELWPLALVLGLAFLTKVQAYALAPVFALLLLLRWRRTGELRLFLGSALTVFLPALLLGALYWGRNWFVCGPADVVCGRWHNQVVVGQPTTSDWIAQYGWWGSASSLLPRFLKFTFDSFWGVFGWMGVFMDSRIYTVLLVFSLALLVGAAAAVRGWPRLTPAERAGLGLLLLSGLTTLGLYLYYNLNFVQHQGRYLFPALIPIALAAAVGIRQWTKWGLKLLHLSPSGRVGAGELLLSLLLLALMAALDVVALYRFVLPQLT